MEHYSRQKLASLTVATSPVRKPVQFWYAKYAFDYVSAFCALIVLSPLFLLLAILIKLDSRGPVFFRQSRHGLNNEVFMMYKFRTMTAQACRQKKFKQATYNDNRVTRLGRFLRKTSLDELPQILNILQGDMSVIGPRPHPIALNNAFAKKIRYYNYRHFVKPGITGWAQVRGHRGPTPTTKSMKLRVDHDLEYIQNWSLWLDCKILARTAIMFFHTGS